MTAESVMHDRWRALYSVTALRVGLINLRCIVQCENNIAEVQQPSKKPGLKNKWPK